MIKSLFYSESFKKGFALSSSLNFISKIIGFLNIAIIAYFFGTTSATDVYFYVFAFMGTLSSFLISLNATILIPEAMRMKEQGSEKESQHFLSYFLLLYIIICIIISLIFIINPMAIFSLLSKFTSQTLNENVTVLYCCIPLLALLTINTFLTDILISYRFFSASVLGALLNSIFSILMIFALHKQFHILSVLIGVLFANILQLSVNIFFLVHNLHWTFRFNPIKIKSKTSHDIIAAQAGNFATMLTGYIPLLLLSSFPSGILSSINYGSRIPDMVTLLITVQFGTVTGIKFNELYAQKKENEIRKAYIDASSFLQFVLIPICVLIFIYSLDIITILFGHGAFGRTSILHASQFLKLFILTVPFAAHNVLVARLFMAAQKINKSYIFQIIMSCVMVVMVFFTIEILGPVGYPFGLLLFNILNAISIIIIVKQNFRFLPYEKTLIYTVKCCLLNAPLACILIFMNKFLVTNSIVVIGGTSIVYLAVIIFVNQKLHINRQFSELIETFTNRVL